MEHTEEELQELKQKQQQEHQEQPKDPQEPPQQQQPPEVIELQIYLVMHYNTDDKYALLKFPINEGPNTIGRDPASELQIQNPQLPLKMAVLIRDGQRHWIKKSQEDVRVWIVRDKVQDNRELQFEEQYELQLGEKFGVQDMKGYILQRKKKPPPYEFFYEVDYKERYLERNAKIVEFYRRKKPKEDIFYVAGTKFRRQTFQMQKERLEFEKNLPPTVFFDSDYQETDMELYLRYADKKRRLDRIEEEIQRKERQKKLEREEEERIKRKELEKELVIKRQEEEILRKRENEALCFGPTQELTQEDLLFVPNPSFVMPPTIQIGEEHLHGFQNFVMPPTIQIGEQEQYFARFGGVMPPTIPFSSEITELDRQRDLQLQQKQRQKQRQRQIQIQIQKQKERNKPPYIKPEIDPRFCFPVRPHMDKRRPPTPPKIPTTKSQIWVQNQEFIVPIYDDVVPPPPIVHHVVKIIYPPGQQPKFKPVALSGITYTEDIRRKLRRLGMKTIQNQDDKYEALIINQENPKLCWRLLESLLSNIEILGNTILDKKKAIKCKLYDLTWRQIMNIKDRTQLFAKRKQSPPQFRVYLSPHVFEKQYEKLIELAGGKKVEKVVPEQSETFFFLSEDDLEIYRMCRGNLWNSFFNKDKFFEFVITAEYPKKQIGESFFEMREIEKMLESERIENVMGEKLFVTGPKGEEDKKNTK